jgi:hypothetical protein
MEIRRELLSYFAVSTAIAAHEIIEHGLSCSENRQDL